MNNIELVERLTPIFNIYSDCLLDSDASIVSYAISAKLGYFRSYLYAYCQNKRSGMNIKLDEGTYLRNPLMTSQWYKASTIAEEAIMAYLLPVGVDTSIFMLVVEGRKPKEIENINK